MFNSRQFRSIARHLADHTAVDLHMIAAVPSADASRAKFVALTSSSIGRVFVERITVDLDNLPVYSPVDLPVALASGVSYGDDMDAAMRAFSKLALSTRPV